MNSFISKKNNTFKSLVFTLILFIIPLNSFAQGSREGDWFSTDTLSSVVKLSSLLCVYDLEGLPDNYTFRTKNGKPDFGDATVVSEQSVLEHVGSGVVVTKQGMILSNAHVTRAYKIPEIFSIQNSEGRYMTGPHGKIIKRVIWNPVSDYMFVGVSDKDRLERGKDAQQLQYIAYILADDADYDKQIRDRAVLQVVTTAHLNSDGLPVADDDVDFSSLSMSYSTLGNPFETSYSDRKVRAIGFPGSGDPNRSARTSGELMGYESEKRSVILHTSYISNGNSGGGLFYKDNLIGINTWDNRSNSSRPVAMAQPITYWDDMFAKILWLYPNVEIPDVYVSWIADDPSNEDYKDMAQIMFEVVEEANQNNPVTKGTLYVHKGGTTIDEILEYKDVAESLNNAYVLMRYLDYYTVDEVVEETGCNRSLAEALKNLTSLSQLKDILNDNIKKYFDVWYSGEFYYTQTKLDQDNGKAILAIPKDSNVEVTYLAENESDYRNWTLKVDSDYLQGPFKLSVKNK